MILELAGQLGNGWVAAEMAVPSYCHKNPLIRSRFWKRQDRSLELAKLDPEETVLGFGCGCGVALPSLARHAKEVIAVDLDPERPTT